MKELKIIGIGSPFGMDRLGWDVIDFLQKQNQYAVEYIELIKLDRPATDLLAWMDADNKIIIIDAINGNHQAGTVIKLKVADLPETGSKLSSHDIGLSGALKLAETLGQLPDDLLIIGMETGGKTSEVVQPEHIRNVADQVLREAGL